MQHKIRENQLSRLVGSSMDGSGVSLILLETKKNNQRQLSGFLVKIGVGIREPWVMHKVPKNQLDEIIKGQSLEIKHVSKGYVNKLVRHFLFETISNNLVPDAAFIEIAELFCADSWQPLALSWSDEMNRLREIYTNKLTDTLINEALQRSHHWHSNEVIASSWFEAGDVVKKALIDAADEHKNDPSLSLVDISTDNLFQHCLDKWKMIFLVTCLWMRSREIHKAAGDLFTILHCLDNNVAPSRIPLLRTLTMETTQSVIYREMMQ